MDEIPKGEKKKSMKKKKGKKVFVSREPEEEMQLPDYFEEGPRINEINEQILEKQADGSLIWVNDVTLNAGPEIPPEEDRFDDLEGILDRRVKDGKIVEVPDLRVKNEDIMRSRDLPYPGEEEEWKMREKIDRIREEYQTDDKLILNTFTKLNEGEEEYTDYIQPNRDRERDEYHAEQEELDQELDASILPESLDHPGTKPRVMQEGRTYRSSVQPEYNLEAEFPVKTIYYTGAHEPQKSATSQPEYLQDLQINPKNHQKVEPKKASISFEPEQNLEFTGSQQTYQPEITRDATPGLEGNFVGKSYVSQSGSQRSSWHSRNFQPQTSSEMTKELQTQVGREYITNAQAYSTSEEILGYSGDSVTSSPQQKLDLVQPDSSAELPEVNQQVTLPPARGTEKKTVRFNAEPQVVVFERTPEAFLPRPRTTTQHPDPQTSIEATRVFYPYTYQEPEKDVRSAAAPAETQTERSAVSPTLDVKSSVPRGTQNTDIDANRDLRPENPKVASSIPEVPVKQELDSEVAADLQANLKSQVYLPSPRVSAQQLEIETEASRIEPKTKVSENKVLFENEYPETGTKYRATTSGKVSRVIRYNFLGQPIIPVEIAAKPKTQSQRDPGVRQSFDQSMNIQRQGSLKKTMNHYINKLVRPNTEVSLESWMGTRTVQPPRSVNPVKQGYRLEVYADQELKPAKAVPKVEELPVRLSRLEFTAEPEGVRPEYKTPVSVVTPKESLLEFNLDRSFMGKLPKGERVFVEKDQRNRGASHRSNYLFGGERVDNFYDLEGSFEEQRMQDFRRQVQSTREKRQRAFGYQNDQPLEQTSFESIGFVMEDDL